MTGDDERFITRHILPGAAVSLLIGNVFYALQAHWVARREKRSDVTALPYGINTPSLLVYVFFVMGPTSLYMAPEAIARPEAADSRSDLYAVAAVGYFMLSGQHVFAGSSVVELLDSHLHETPVRIRERLGAAVPPDLEALLLRGLHKSPADRPPSAAAFRQALLGCDIPRWTQEDARAWWRTHGERARRGDTSAFDLTHAPTVTLVGERALPH
jgi:hypothetical protein